MLLAITFLSSQWVFKTVIILTWYCLYICGLEGTAMIWGQSCLHSNRRIPVFTPNFFASPDGAMTQAVGLLCVTTPIGLPLNSGDSCCSQLAKKLFMSIYMITAP